MSRTPLLIAEDDIDIAATLARGFSADGYSPRIAHDAATALDIAQTGTVDAAIVDMMLGNDDGAELVKQLRQQGVVGPILILSALSGVEERMLGLEAGADDYIAKPFAYEELLTRLRVQQKRRAAPADFPQAIALFGPLQYDRDRRMVIAGRHSVELTEREADLLRFLAAHDGKLVTRQEIMHELWADDGSSSEKVVDVYIGYLRRKLSPVEAFGVSLKTVRGRGFILSES